LIIPSPLAVYSSRKESFQPIVPPFWWRSPSEKAALFKEYGAIAVDMESAAVARAALDAKVPFAAIRAVTDPAQMKIPPTVIESIDEFGRFRPLHLLQSLVRHPGDLLLLVRLGRNFHAARRTLAGVIRLTGEQLLAP
jgi:adenosylhomocysteine nucleosidase